jgi:hypothetical protein
VPRQLIEVSGRDWEAADLVLDHAIAVADTFEARSHHGVWAAGEDRHLFLSLRPEVEIGDQVPPDYDVVLRGTLSEPVRLELHQLQESLAWDFRLLDGERTVYHWGPGDHGRARFPAEAAARLSSQLDQQGLQ